MTKDLGLAVDLGRDLGVPLELGALVEQLHRRARAIYGDEAGELSAVRLVEEAAGVKLRLGQAADATSGRRREPCPTLARPPLRDRIQSLTTIRTMLSMQPWC